MKNIISSLLVGASVCLVACNSNPKSEQKIYTIADLETQIGNLVDDTISIQGLCLNVCGHGSNHITLMGDDTTQMIEVRADDKLQSFNPDVVNTIVNVKGVVTEDRIDTAYLNNWEFKLDESLKGDNGNPEAVAMLKEQIVMLRDSISSRNAREGKNYYSIYKVVASEYATAAE